MLTLKYVFKLVMGEQNELAGDGPLIPFAPFVPNHTMLTLRADVVCNRVSDQVQVKYCPVIESCTVGVSLQTCQTVRVCLVEEHRCTQPRSAGPTQPALCSS